MCSLVFIGRLVLIKNHTLFFCSIFPIKMKDEHNQQFNATAFVVAAFVVIIEVVFLNKFVVKVD